MRIWDLKIFKQLRKIREKKAVHWCFSLCTFTKDEGEEKREKNFFSQNKKILCLKKIDLDMENDGFITFYPHIYGTDGFLRQNL
ncbi:MAG: hypothetical protein L6V93_11010 [Clostridiales bacterium]|nr:MAG: hypothetical protein L6V93_11010 [Clostridiales bacterium]